MTGHCSEIRRIKAHEKTRRALFEVVTVRMGSVSGCGSARLFALAFMAGFLVLAAVGSGEPLAHDEQAVVIHSHGWSGSSLSFEFHDNRLTLWHCRVTCGSVRNLTLKAIAFVKGNERKLAEVTGPMEADSAGTIYVVRSESNEGNARADETVVGLGFSFECISRDVPVKSGDVVGDRQMVRFIAPRREMPCGVGEEKVLCGYLFGDAGIGDEEQERVHDAAAEGDVKKLFASAKACAQTTVILVMIAAE